MPKHHHQPGAERFDGKFDAADLGRGDDVAGHADDEQFPQPLVEHQLAGNAGIGAAEQHGKGLLPHDQLGPACLVGGQRHASQAGHETPVAVLQDSESFDGRNHGVAETAMDLPILTHSAGRD